MPNRIDIEDCYLGSRAKVQEWKRDFTAEWVRADAEEEFLAVWKSLPPEQHELIKQADPETYAEAEKLANKLEVRYGSDSVQA